MDWYIDLAKQHSKKPWHLNSLRLLNSLLENPNYKTEPRYEFLVVREPLHWSDASDRVVNGIGRKLEERIKHQPFCQTCLEKLKQYFIAP